MCERRRRCSGLGAGLKLKSGARVCVCVRGGGDVVAWVQG